MCFYKPYGKTYTMFKYILEDKEIIFIGILRYRRTGLSIFYKRRNNSKVYNRVLFWNIKDRMITSDFVKSLLSSSAMLSPCAISI